MKLIILSFLTTLLSLTAGAASTANLDDGVILKGRDPVSYFKNEKPKKGNPKISATVDGATYLFSSEENRTEFLANKDKYAPAYEGWCATAVAGGYKYDIDPDNYKITDGRLFLFYKGFLGDAKKDWVKDEPAQITKADKQWPTVKLTEE